MRCSNVTPQTLQDKQRMTQNKTGDGAGRQMGKRRWGQRRRADVTTNAGVTKEDEKKTHATRTADETKDAVTTAPSPQTTKQKGTEAPVRRKGTAEETEETAKGEGERGACPGTSRPQRNYVSGKSTGTGLAGT